MKKLFALLLVAVMALGMVACTGPNTTTEQPSVLADSTATVKPATDAEFMNAEAEIRFALGLLLDRNYITENISQAGEKAANAFVADGMADKNGGNFALNAGEGNGKARA